MGKKEMVLKLQEMANNLGLKNFGEAGEYNYISIYNGRYWIYLGFNYGTPKLSLKYISKEGSGLGCGVSLNLLEPKYTSEEIFEQILGCDLSHQNILSNKDLKNIISYDILPREKKWFNDKEGNFYNL